MSSQRGNVKKTRAQKHKNESFGFKNTLHDTSHQTKLINTLTIDGCCARCKDVLEWRIKYKKYKPLTVQKKCTKCGEKAIKRAYNIICQPCAESSGICAKCGQNKSVNTFGLSEEEMLKKKAQLEQELKFLPERKRRTFHRLNAGGKLAATEEATEAASGPQGDASDSDDPYEESDSGTESIQSESETGLPVEDNGFTVKTDLETCESSGESQRRERISNAYPKKVSFDNVSSHSTENADKVSLENVSSHSTEKVDNNDSVLNDTSDKNFVATENKTTDVNIQDTMADLNL